MNEHLKKLYLMATRNSDFITQRTINKYLPMKNDLVNYDSILELNKNLSEVEIAFKVSPKKLKHQEKILSPISKNKSLSKPSQRTKSKSDFTSPSLLEVYKSNQIMRKSKLKQSNHKLKNSNSITIIEN
jgi:hypothetical protein